VTLFTRRGTAAELVEEVQQERQVRGRLVGIRIAREQCREALAVRRQIVI
jgi:hypothetical protein